MAEVQGTLRNITVGTGERTRELELKKLQPFTLGDRKKLLKDLKLDLRLAMEFRPEEDVSLVMYVLRKVDPSVTMEEVEALPTPVGQSIVEYAILLTQSVDRPFSRSSTPSPPPMGGDSKI